MHRRVGVVTILRSRRKAAEGGGRYGDAVPGDRAVADLRRRAVPAPVGGTGRRVAEHPGMCRIGGAAASHRERGKRDQNKEQDASLGRCRMNLPLRPTP